MQPAVFFFDYVDPASFLVERAVSAAEAAAGQRIERRPFEFRPPPTPLCDPADPAWLSRWAAMSEAARREGIALARPRIVPWTRKAHELAQLARSRGHFDRVHAALFHAFMVEGRDIGRVDVLAELGRDAGLEWTETRAVLDVDKHTAEVARTRIEAERVGIAGVPTLLSGERRLEGLHDADAVLAFIERR